jgi:hypothetical protein
MKGEVPAKVSERYEDVTKNMKGRYSTCTGK